MIVRQSLMRLSVCLVCRTGCLVNRTILLQKETEVIISVIIGRRQSAHFMTSLVIAISAAISALLAVFGDVITFSCEDEKLESCVMISKLKTTEVFISTQHLHALHGYQTDVNCITPLHRGGERMAHPKFWLGEPQCIWPHQ